MTNTDKRPYSAIAVANYFIKKSDYEATPMKIQKLVYLAHGYSLAAHDKPLIREEVGAWPFGPVIGSIYKEFKRFAKISINDFGKENDKPAWIENSDKKTINILEQVWDMYGNYTATQLSNMTHMDGSPWKDVYEDGKSKNISRDVIKKYFKKYIK
ncbi:MAG: DUF4065 domain-containing protein [Alphaproteobacteria bacterium]|nr:DUF4065 domain-containing protein [Alphaproteobacteria bacterium]